MSWEEREAMCFSAAWPEGERGASPSYVRACYAPCSNAGAGLCFLAGCSSTPCLRTLPCCSVSGRASGA